MQQQQQRRQRRRRFWQNCVNYLTAVWLLAALCFMDILTQNWINANAMTDENGTLAEVQTVVGFEVSLPCDLIPASSMFIEDKVTLVIWYKEGRPKPIYTFDARGKPLQQAVHWADDAVFSSKAHFYYDSYPPALRVRTVRREDAGVYRCRVDFQQSPTRNWHIHLFVLVPPAQLDIFDHMGNAARAADNTIGPYREGSSINVTCLSSGGSPAPRVSWWRDHALVDDTFTVQAADGGVRNVLHVAKLCRADLMTVYTCQASNGHVVPPLSKTVKLDLRLPPLFVHLQGLSHPLVSGTLTQATCTTAGARPAPQIVWIKGGILMRGATQTTSLDGNTTVSELAFQPVPEDNGKLVTCSVTTDTVAGSVAGVFLKDSQSLNVIHAPMVSLSLGAPLDPNNLIKGSDVYLECDIKANPPAKLIEWYHNDVQLISSRGIIITNQTLVLQGIAKATHGQYVCRATNPQGTIASNRVYVDVKYPPVCLAESTVIRAALKQTVNVSCGIDSNPALNLSFRWTFNNTLENLTDLPALEKLRSNDGVRLRSTPMPAPDSASSSDDDSDHDDYGDPASSALSSTLPGPHRPVLPNNVYPYRVETFQHFGTISCTAQNAIGQSAPCLYHIMAAEIPDAVHNCTAANATANAVHVACVAGRDGGIRQSFGVEVLDGQSHRVLFNATFQRAQFVVRRLPADADVWLVVTAFNAQGAAAQSARLRVRTLPAPVLQTASSTAVLAELTPLLGALLGVVVTLLLVVVCVMICTRLHYKRSGCVSGNNIAATEPDKGSAEPLSRHIGSHSSIEDKNPDVVRHTQANSDDDNNANGTNGNAAEDDDDEYTSEERAFDRIANGHLDGHHGRHSHRLLSAATPPPLPNAHQHQQQISHQLGQPLLSAGSALLLSSVGISAPHQQQMPPAYHNGASAYANVSSSSSPLHSHAGGKPPAFAKLSLTTNPAYALYNNSPTRQLPPVLYSASAKGSSDSGSRATSPNANIYTHVPMRPFVPYEHQPAAMNGLDPMPMPMHPLHSPPQRSLSPTYDTYISPIYASGSVASATSPTQPLMLQQRSYQLPAMPTSSHHRLQGSAGTLTAGSCSASVSGDETTAAATQYNHNHNLPPSIGAMATAFYQQQQQQSDAYSAYHPAHLYSADS